MSIMRSPGRCSRTRRAPHPPPSLPPGERLSWVSSGLPWFLVSQDGVEDGEELAGDGDEGDHVGLSGGAEAFAGGLEDGVVTGRDEGGQEQGGAHALASAGDHALAFPVAGLAGGGGEGGGGWGFFFCWG